MGGSNAAKREAQFSPPPSEKDPKVGYYEPQERRSEQLNTRVPKSVQDGLKDLAKLWTHLEKVRAAAEAKETGKKMRPVSVISVSDVVVRLLQVGLTGAWAEIGMHPQTDAEWKEVFARAERLYSEPLKK